MSSYPTPPGHNSSSPPNTHIKTGQSDLDCGVHGSSEEVVTRRIYCQRGEGASMTLDLGQRRRHTGTPQRHTPIKVP